MIYKYGLIVIIIKKRELKNQIKFVNQRQRIPITNNIGGTLMLLCGKNATAS